MLYSQSISNTLMQINDYETKLQKYLHITQFVIHKLIVVL